jgi:hypothetical protein
VPARVSSPAFVGRAGELERLEAALARAERGAAAAVFVGGESGVGKTRLLRELERLAAARGARVLRGDCPPRRSPQPCAAWHGTSSPLPSTSSWARPAATSPGCCPS